MHRLSALLAIAILAGCTTARPPVHMPVAPGFSPVIPGGTMKVGHLYFPGKGRYPAFYDAKGTLFSEFCWGDFAKDSVLRGIAGQVEETPDPLTNFADNAKGSASFGLPELISMEGTANTDAKVSGITRVTLTPEGVRMVLDNLGPNCRKLIEAYSPSRDIVLLAAAQRADTMTLSANAKLSLEASLGRLIGLTPVEAGAEGGQALQYRMVYLSTNLGPTAPDAQ